MRAGHRLQRETGGGQAQEGDLRAGEVSQGRSGWPDPCPRRAPALQPLQAVKQQKDLLVWSLGDLSLLLLQLEAEGTAPAQGLAGPGSATSGDLKVLSP